MLYRCYIIYNIQKIDEKAILFNLVFLQICKRLYIKYHMKLIKKMKKYSVEILVLNQILKLATLLTR